MPYTEFYCNSFPGSGFNYNAGSTEQSNPIFTTTGTWTTGANASSFSFSCAPSTDLSIVTSGMFASVISGTTGTSAGLGNSTLIALITGVNDSADIIYLHNNRRSGTQANCTGTIRVGGCWMGPSDAVEFPFAFITSGLMNMSGFPPRVNFKNNNDYNITAAIDHNIAGPLFLQGYTNTPGDFGRFRIKTATANVNLLDFGNTASRITLRDFEIISTASANASHNLELGTASTFWIERFFISGARGAGINCLGGGVIANGEIVNCNKSNTAATAGIILSNSAHCYVDSVNIHDCIPGSNGNGIYIATGPLSYIENCRIYNNSGEGIYIAAQTMSDIRHCDFFKNRNSIRNQAAAGRIKLQNCNFVNSLMFGILITGANNINRQIIINDCGYYNNASGNIYQFNTGINFGAGINAFEEDYPTYYTNSVFKNPIFGDFTIINNQAIGKGYNLVPSISGSNSSISYPNIGSYKNPGHRTSNLPGGIVR